MKREKVICYYCDKAVKDGEGTNFMVEDECLMTVHFKCWVDKLKKLKEL